METFIKIGFSAIIFLLFSFDSVAQDDNLDVNTGFEIGPEIQVYPAGIIPGIRIEKYLNSKSSINLRVGYQIMDHRDLGVQDDETGTGFGASLAYRRFFKSNQKGLSLAFRTDLWFNEMDWETDNTKGVTTITVVQPTLVGEYAFRLSPNLFITPSLGFGFEWNVKTEGEPTGEGAILLIGCSFGYRL